jgi:hypothetical protein
MPRPPLNLHLRVIDKYAALLLQLVHERVFFIGIERFIEAAQSQ